MRKRVVEIAALVAFLVAGMAFAVAPENCKTYSTDPKGSELRGLSLVTNISGTLQEKKDSASGYIPH